MHSKSTGLVGNGKWGKILQKKIQTNSNLIFTANSKSKYFSKISQLDWIFIATPDATHYKIVNKCLDKKMVLMVSIRSTLMGTYKNQRPSD